MIKQIAWRVLQAAVMIDVTVYVYQHIWADTPPPLVVIIAILSGILAAAAATAIINHACSPRAWPIRTTQLLVVLAISILGWKDNPIGAVIFGLLSALTVTITIDMTIALVARVKASFARFSRHPMQRRAVETLEVGRRALKGRLGVTAEHARAALVLQKPLDD